MMSMEANDFLDKFSLRQRNWTMGELLERIGVTEGVDGALLGPVESRFKAYALAVEHGFMTPAEVRKLERLPVLEEK